MTFEYISNHQKASRTCQTNFPDVIEVNKSFLSFFFSSLLKYSLLCDHTYVLINICIHTCTNTQKNADLFQWGVM